MSPWILLLLTAVRASFDSTYLDQYLHYTAEFDTLSTASYLNHSNHCLNKYYASSTRVYRNPPRFCRLKNQQEYNSGDTSNGFTKISPRAIVTATTTAKTSLPVHSSLLCDYRMKARGAKLIAQGNYAYLVITQSDCHTKGLKVIKEGRKGSNGKHGTGIDMKGFDASNGGAAFEVISIPVALNTLGQMRVIKTAEGDAVSANCRVTDRVHVADSYEVQCPMYRGDLESMEDVRKCIYVKAFLDYEHYDAFNELMGAQRPFRAGIPGTGLYCDRAVRERYQKGSLPYDTIESIMRRQPEKDYSLSYRPHLDTVTSSSGSEMEFKTLSKDATRSCLLTPSNPVYFLGDSHTRYLFDAILLKYVDAATQGAAATALKKGPHHHAHLDIHQSIFYRPVRFAVEFNKILEHICYAMEGKESVTLVIQLGSWDLDYAPLSNVLKDSKHMPRLLTLVKEIMNGEIDCTSNRFRFVFIEAPPFPVLKQYRYYSTGSASDRYVDEGRKREDRERFEKNKERVRSNLNSGGNDGSSGGNEGGNKSGGSGGSDGSDGIGGNGNGDSNGNGNSDGNMISTDLEDVSLYSLPPQKLSMDTIDTTITSNAYSGFRNDYNLAAFNEFLHREISKIQESVKGSNHSIETVNMYQSLFPYRDNVLCATHYMCLNLQKSRDVVDMDFTRAGYLFMESFLKQLCLK